MRTIYLLLRLQLLHLVLRLRLLLVRTKVFVPFIAKIINNSIYPVGWDAPNGMYIMHNNNRHIGTYIEINWNIGNRGGKLQLQLLVTSEPLTRYRLAVEKCHPSICPTNQNDPAPRGHPLASWRLCWNGRQTNQLPTLHQCHSHAGCT